MGGEVDKTSLNFMTATVVKCDLFNPFLSLPPPVSDLIAHVADCCRFGEIHYFGHR